MWILFSHDGGYSLTIPYHPRRFLQGGQRAVAGTETPHAVKTRRRLLLVSDKTLIDDNRIEAAARLFLLSNALGDLSVLSAETEIRHHQQIGFAVVVLFHHFDSGLQRLVCIRAAVKGTR